MHVLLTSMLCCSMHESVVKSDAYIMCALELYYLYALQ